MSDTDLREYGPFDNVKANHAFSDSDHILTGWLITMFEAIESVDSRSWRKILPLSTKIAQKRVPTWAVAYDWDGPQAARLLCVDNNPQKGLLRAWVEKSCRGLLIRHDICQKLVGSSGSEEPDIDSLMLVWLVNETGGYLEHARRVLDKGGSRLVQRPRVPSKQIGPDKVQLWLHLGFKLDGGHKECVFPFAEFLYPDRYSGDVQSPADSKSLTGSTGDVASMTSATPSNRASDLLTSDSRTQTCQGSSVLSQAPEGSSYSLRMSSAYTSVPDFSSATSNSDIRRPVIRDPDLDSILKQTADTVRKGDGGYAHTR